MISKRLFSAPILIHLYPQPSFDRECNARGEIDGFHRYPAAKRLPGSRSRQVFMFIKPEIGVGLQDLNEEESRFMIGKLLTKANTGTTIEGKEDEGIRG